MTEQRMESTRFHWLRPAVGAALILHALAHAGAVINVGIRIGALNGASSADRAQSSLWLASLLSAFTITTLLAAGLGALRVRAFAARWTSRAMIGLLASFIFLFFFAPAGKLVGVGVGCALLFLLYEAIHKHVLTPDPRSITPASPARRMARYVWLAALTGLALSLAFRPLFLRWNTSPREAYYELPGDMSAPGKGFQILHAININATPDQVWPWLAQIGHDRGGFYSYSWLENLFGLSVVNADRIVPAWQTRAIGELVPATPPNWLGLFDKPMGWRVLSFEPGRLLYLENWGAFALVPVGPVTTRLYIRSQGTADSTASLWWSPLELLIFEPAHFIMQRKMLLGIKQRAEQFARQQRSALAPLRDAATGGPSLE